MPEVKAALRTAGLIEELCNNRTQTVQGSIAIVVAHQDDEVVSMGGRFGMLKDVYFIHVTDGAPKNMSDARKHGYSTRDAYAHVRQCELATALSLANFDQNRSIELGITDQDASKNLVYLAHELADMLMYLKPEFVLTHPYEGGHPDHDATTFAVHASLALIERSGIEAPALCEFASYYNDRGTIAALEFLPGSDPGKTVWLTSEQKKLKGQMIQCFITQRDTLKYFPLEAERFRTAPDYMFSQPPHEGTLYYELFDWGMRGNQWRQLASEAMASLELQGQL